MENQESAPGPAPSSSGMDPKTLGIITYLTLIGFIIGFVIYNGNKTEYAAFHVRQMLGLVLCGVVMQVSAFVLAFIPILGWAVIGIAWIFLVVLWVIGFIGALNNEQKLVPVLGEKFQEWFSGI